MKNPGYYNSTKNNKHLTERINNVQNVNLKINLELKYPGIYF